MRDAKCALMMRTGVSAAAGEWGGGRAVCLLRHISSCRDAVRVRVGVERERGTCTRQVIRGTRGSKSQLNPGGRQRRRRCER